MKPVRLGIYVGSLTRYYLHEWEGDNGDVPRQGQEAEAAEVLQRARSQGLEAVRLQRRKSGTGPSSAAEVRRAILQWQTALSQGLGHHLRQPLRWDETASAGSAAVVLAGAYASLLLLAAYQDQPDRTAPELLPPDWHQDAAWLGSTSHQWRTTASPHLLAADWWLPCSFNMVFEARDPGGEDVVIGSSLALHAELQRLNQKTFRGTAANLASWLHAGPPAETTLRAQARYALAVLLERADRAVTQTLPMLLHDGN